MTILPEIEIVRRTAASGLPVLLVPQPHLHRAHVALYVRTGSRFETKQTNGISHFLEHMIYRGTPRLKSAHEVNRAFESLGGTLHAETRVDFGIFSLSLPPECLARGVELFADVLLNPEFFDIELEKGIVSEEILEDLDDDGRQIDADNLCRELIYPGHPLGYTITGSAETVRSFTLETLRAHHKEHYTTENAILAFAGPIPESDLPALMSHFDVFPIGKRIEAVKPAPAKPGPHFLFLENSSSQTELRVTFRAPADTSPLRPALELAMRLIDDGMSTRLYQRICDEKGLCYDCTAGYDGYEDDGVVDFTAGVLHTRAAQVTEEILALITELATDGPSEEELAKARLRHSWEQRQMLDSPEEAAGFFAISDLFKQPNTPHASQERMKSITREQIVEAVRAFAKPENLYIVAVGLVEPDEESRVRNVVANFRGIR